MPKTTFHPQTESVAEQDYLKQIYLLQEAGTRATTQALAERLGVKPPSVTAMIKRLADDHDGPFLRHTPYHGVELTDRGTMVALEMIRHHRLIEVLLTEVLDVPWDRVHAEAERLEHVLSDDLEERIAAKLGHPTRDPHGEPIPGVDGGMEPPNDVLLAAVPVGSAVVITRVPDGDPALLQYLAGVGMMPGTGLVIGGSDAMAGVITVRTDDGAEHVLGEGLAGRIRVFRVQTDGGAR